MRENATEPGDAFPTIRKAVAPEADYRAVSL